MKILTWDGTGAIVIHKKLDAGRFELPKPTCVGEQQVVVSDAIFDVIFKGIAATPKAPRCARASSLMPLHARSLMALTVAFEKRSG